MKVAEMSVLAVLGVVAALSSGCSDHPFETRAGESASSVAPVFRIAAPEIPGGRLLANDGDENKYRITERADLEVTVDGERLTFESTADDAPFTARFSRPPGSRVEVRAEWVENIELGDGGTLQLPLAVFERSITIDRDMSIDIRPDDYAVDPGPGFARDADRDGDGNLFERVSGFSPFNGSSCPTSSSCDPAVDLYVKRVERAVTNRIMFDGSYDGEWNSSEAFSRDGRLFIENFGASSEPGNGNGGTGRFDGDGADPFKFLAMHDGESLYVAAVGDQNAERNTPHGDSADPAADDALVLYLDTDDLSDGRLTSRIVIPLLGRDTGEANVWNRPSGRATQAGFGPDPTALPTGLRFATCVCDDNRQYWEMSIPLATLGVVPGEPFGLDVAMHDDSTGGDTVTQWFWHSPAGTDGNTGVVAGRVVARR